MLIAYLYSNDRKRIVISRDSINFIKGNKYLLFKELSYFAKSKYEKKLFKIALNDVKRFNDIEDKSTKIHQRKD